MRFLELLFGDHGIVPQPVKRWEWKERETSFSTEHELVDLATTRILASVVLYHSGPNYHVFKNGAGYGEYQSLESAKRKAEELA